MKFDALLLLYTFFLSFVTDKFCSCLQHENARAQESAILVNMLIIIVYCKLAFDFVVWMVSGSHGFSTSVVNSHCHGVGGCIFLPIYGRNSICMYCQNELVLVYILNCIIDILVH